MKNIISNKNILKIKIEKRRQNLEQNSMNKEYEQLEGKNLGRELQEQNFENARQINFANKHLLPDFETNFKKYSETKIKQKKWKRLK